MFQIKSNVLCQLCINFSFTDANSFLFFFFFFSQNNKILESVSSSMNPIVQRTFFCRRLKKKKKNCKIIERNALTRNERTRCPRNVIILVMNLLRAEKMTQLRSRMKPGIVWTTMTTRVFEWFINRQPDARGRVSRIPCDRVSWKRGISLEREIANDRISRLDDTVIRLHDVRVSLPLRLTTFNWIRVELKQAD